VVEVDGRHLLGAFEHVVAPLEIGLVLSRAEVSRRFRLFR